MKQTCRIFLSMFIGLVVSTVCHAQSKQNFSSMEHIRNDLSDDTAVLIYANVDQPTMIRMLITKEHISGSERSGHTFVKDMLAQYGSDIATTLPNDEQKSETFATLITYYRTLLQNPTTTDRSSEISSRLYEFLVGDIQEQIEGKARLVIVPDGMLNFLPFETLVDKHNKYLVENYQISYIQSLGVWELLQQRRYDQERKPLLAISPERTHEVHALQNIVDGADILIGDDATEAHLKALSASGKLAEYKTLHFATKAIITPETPEQSALVLSQFEPSPDPSQEGKTIETLALQGEDGYLRVDEIDQLKLKADFVNLSGGETGLGKLYKGEGVVGFTQAFMRAGANSLSVSLWQVADEATTAFMTALYELVENPSNSIRTGQGLNYAEAMTDVKRRFINGNFGEKWQAPYYWAPFVYYGR